MGRSLERQRSKFLGYLSGQPYIKKKGEIASMDLPFRNLNHRGPHLERPID